MNRLLREYHGQTYLLIGTRAHQRRDGSLTNLDVWQTKCADCGDTFEFSIPSKAKRFEPNRRCQKHKRPGQRVQP